MKLIRDNTYDIDIVIVTSNSGSGKSLVGRLLESYSRVEKLREDYIFYHISRLHSLKKIDEDTAICVLKTYKDNFIYDLMIGRKINCRISDDTSIFKYSYPLDYMKRIFKGEHEEVNQRINNENPIFQNMIVSGLTHSQLFFDAFKSNLKIIYISRNPIEVIKQNIVNSYIGEENRIGNDPSEVQFSYMYKDKMIPVYALGWEEDYLKANPTERTIKLLYDSMISDYRGYRHLNSENKRNVKLISFDRLVTDTDAVLEDISLFLDDYPTKRIRRIMKKEKCPRILDMEKRESDRQEILNNISDPYVELFNLLMREYEKDI